MSIALEVGGGIGIAVACYCFYRAFTELKSLGQGGRLPTAARQTRKRFP